MNLNQLESPAFAPCLYDKSLYSLEGCVPCALALLTGVSPRTINENYSGKWSESKIIRFLRKKNFTCYKLSDRILKTRSDVIEENLRPYHLVLTIQKMNKKETSVQVIWDGYVFHNFSIAPLRPLEFVNNRLISAWVLKRRA